MKDSCNNILCCDVIWVKKTFTWCSFQNCFKHDFRMSITWFTPSGSLKIQLTSFWEIKLKGGSIVTINRAWNRSASFRLTQWLKIIPHMIRSYYHSCCIHVNEPIIFSHCAHLKLGHRFHALSKVIPCSDHDDTARLKYRGIFNRLFQTFELQSCNFQCYIFPF